MKKILAIAFVYAAINSVSGQETFNYSNATFEISCQRPNFWMEGSEKGFDKTIKLSPKERTLMLKEYGGLYLIDFYKFFTLGKSTDPGPKIQIDVIYKPEKSFDTFKQKSIASSEELGEMLDNYVLTHKPEELMISGIKSIYFLSTYSMVVKGQRIDLKNRTYFIPYNDYLFHISMVETPSENCGKVFDEFLSTIKIGN